MWRWLCWWVCSCCLGELALRFASLPLLAPLGQLKRHHFRQYKVRSTSLLSLRLPWLSGPARLICCADAFHLALHGMVGLEAHLRPVVMKLWRTAAAVLYVGVRTNPAKDAMG